MSPDKLSKTFLASPIVNKITQFNLLLLVLMAKAIAMAGLAAYYVLDAEEAQYWLWSQHLDWGYFSKPPGIAWEISASTSLFGNTEFGVRFGAILLGIFLPLAVYHLAWACGTGTSAACLGALLFALLRLA